MDILYYLGCMDILYYLANTSSGIFHCVEFLLCYILKAGYVFVIRWKRRKEF